jgi:hypothetical protein
MLEEQLLLLGVKAQACCINSVAASLSRASNDEVNERFVSPLLLCHQC